MSDAGASAITSEPDPDWVTITDDAAWVANVGEGIGRYDLATGELVGEVETRGRICLAMDAGFGSLWAADCLEMAILRIDEATGEVRASIAVPFDTVLPPESSVAVGEDAVWVLSSGDDPRLARIDPATDEVTDTFEAPRGAAGLRASANALWVTLPDAGQLLRLDPVDASVQATIEVAAGGRFLAAEDEAVWVLGAGEAVVSRVDPASDEVVASIRVGESPVSGGDINVGGGFVWARVSDSLVAQIDPVTNSVVARFGEPEGSGSADADGEALWISAHDVLTVYRVPLPGS